MQQEEKVIVLPDHEEMLRRLVEVDDTPHFQRKLYPIILRAAGRELFPMGVVMMLTVAIHDYSEGMPGTLEEAVLWSAPRFIDALIDDKDAATEAKAFLKALKG